MPEKYFPYIPILFIFVILSVYFIGKKILFIKNAMRATGRIIQHSSGTLTTGSEGTSKEIIEFEVNGKIIRFSSFMGTSHPAPIGGFVSILYEKENPETAVINNFTNLWVFEIIILVVGWSILIASLSEA